METRDEAGLGPGASRRVDDQADGKAPLVGLVHQLQRAIGVAERADRVRAAARNDVGPLAGRLQARRDLLHGGVHVAAARNVAERCAVQMVEEDVAVVVVVGAGNAGAVLQHGVAVEAEAGAEGGGLAHVVGLGGALGDHRVGAQRLGLAHQEFQLAGLVAAGGHAGAVVALDEEARAAEGLRQAVHRLQRGRQVGKVKAREAGEVHGRDCPLVAAI